VLTYADGYVFGDIAGTPTPHCFGAVGADLKVMQELLRHSTIRVTLDTYTQAVTAAKRAAHTAVVSLIVGNGE
jgi:integrase